MQWTPTKRQAAFASCPAYEALFGGAASGGKTEILVLNALRHVDKPDYRALILRRTFPELERDIIPLAHKYYRWVSGIYHTQHKTWRFPSGAAIEFGHLEGEQDVHKYQGLEVQYLAFDELSTFTEAQYKYLLSRVRSSSGIPVRVRAATNPGAEWVLNRWAPWLEKPEKLQQLKLPRAAPDEILHYDNTEKGEIYHPGGFLTRAFFPSKIEDNPYILAHDPGYRQRLMGLDPVTRAQLLHGDWHVRPAAGVYFKRQWFKWCAPNALPARRKRVRRWDLASVEGGGDYTVGVLLSRDMEGLCYVEDVVRDRLSPRRVEQLICATAEMDGHATQIWLPQDPGQAGVAQVASYTRLLAGWPIKFVRETGDKITRAQPASAQCEAGNVTLVHGAWNNVFVGELEAFPDDTHDDQVDAFAGAMVALADYKRTWAERWADVQV